MLVYCEIVLSDMIAYFWHHIHGQFFKSSFQVLTLFPCCYPINNKMQYIPVAWNRVVENLSPFGSLICWCFNSLTFIISTLTVIKLLNGD